MPLFRYAAWYTKFLLCFVMFSTRPCPAQSVESAQPLQQQTKSVPEAADLAVSSPTRSAVGTIDPGALTELKSFASATGLLTWRGMIAQGSLTLPGADTSVQATLYKLPGHKTRLDIAAVGRETETSVSDGVVWRARVGKSAESMVSGHAGVAGILPFDYPAEALVHLDQLVALDKGSIMIGDRLLHEVTLEVPMPIWQIVPGGPARSVLDCYFDPNTHLLARTTSLFNLPDAGRYTFTRSTSYSGYKATDGVTLPTRITETLDGRKVWSMDITSVDVTSAPKADLF